jgi:FkbM family methyltransferase
MKSSTKFRLLFLKMKEVFWLYAPDWVYALIAIPYFLLEAYLKKRIVIRIAPMKDVWFVSDGKNSFFVPTVKAARYPLYFAEPYERYFEIKRGDIVFDIGACVGEFAIPSARKVGEEGLVIAIEPEPRNLTCLLMNIAWNRLSNVKIIGKGVWRSKGVLKLTLGVGGAITSHSLKNPEKGGSVKIPVDTLDNIASSFGRIDFIKIDAEGAEVEILEAGGKTLARAKKVVLEVESKKDVDLIRRTLQTFGYNVLVDTSGIFFYIYAEKK